MLRGRGPRGRLAQVEGLGLGAIMTHEHGPEISLIDTALFLAENWIAIFIAPLVVAMAVYFAVGHINRPIEATATVTLPSVAGREPSSPIPMLVSRLAISADRIREGGVGVTIERGAIDISAVASTEERSRSLVANELKSLQEITSQIIESHVERVEKAESYLLPLEGAILGSDVGGISLDAAVATATLRQRIDSITNDLPTLQSVADALSMAPIAVEPRGRSPSDYAIFALFGFGCVSLLLCLLRTMWHRAAKDPVNQDKIRRIRAALLLRRPR